jgi:hypothetical protein
MPAIQQITLEEFLSRYPRRGIAKLTIARQSFELVFRIRIGHSVTVHACAHNEQSLYVSVSEVRTLHPVRHNRLYFPLHTYDLPADALYRLLCALIEHQIPRDSLYYKLFTAR